MKISILTLFPNMFKGPFDESIIRRAYEKGLVEIQLTNIRDFGIGAHQVVDDTPYGGGVGMVMKVDVVHAALKEVTKKTYPKQKIILMSAQGKKFDQKMADEYSHLDHLVIISGHYEGIDTRIRDYIDEEVSVGDFVTTGGEIPSMLIADSVTRRIPGVLKNEATENESFQKGLLEHPQYTKPPIYEGKEVPEVLLSGNHKAINEWREQLSHEETKEKRPDLL